MSIVVVCVGILNCHRSDIMACWKKGEEKCCVISPGSKIHKHLMSQSDSELSANIDCIVDPSSPIGAGR